MDYRKLGNTFAVIALVLFMVSLIGMVSNGSHRWVEPFQQAGWICFVIAMLVLYLLTPEAADNDPMWANAAWVFGGLAILLFLSGMIVNAATVIDRSWYEALEAGGSIATLLTIVTALYSRHGWKRKETE
jgi:cell division protein FtsW (lipid II flippase)